jgi:hypothetical protein
MAQVNLKGLFGILQDVLSQSKLIGGRFFVLSASTKDINSTNFGQIFKDALGGITTINKYPCAVILPPYKLKKNDQKGFGRYKIQIYFLVLDKRNQNIDIKNVDIDTNLSMQQYMDDWNDTNIIADQFFISLFQYTQIAGIMNAFQEEKDTRQYHFLTAVGNDKLNGTHISFEVRIWEGDNCEPASDYPTPIVVNMTDFSPNTLNKQ